MNNGNCLSDEDGDDEVITLEEAKQALVDLSNQVGRNIVAEVESLYTLEQFRDGMEVELEHGPRDPETDVTGGDLVKTARIALAHLREYANYYILLKEMEEEAERQMREKRVRGLSIYPPLSSRKPPYLR